MALNKINEYTQVADKNLIQKIENVTDSKKLLSGAALST